MRYDLLKIWPSAILGCFLFGLAYKDGLREFFWFFIIIWVGIGVVSYNLNGRAHLRETLIENLVWWLIIGVVIGIIYISSMI
jgi:hypothetical protein